MSRKYLSFETMKAVDALNQILDRNVLAKLKSYTSDNPLMDVTSIVLEQTLVHTEYNEVAVERLIDVLGTAAPLDIAVQVVALIESLPWHYVYALPLPDSLDAAFPAHGFWKLGEDAKIAKGVGLTEKFEVATSPSSFMNALSGQRSFFTNPGPTSAHLLIDAYGTIDQYSSTYPQLQAFEDMKSIIGLMMALGLLRYRSTWKRNHPLVEVHINREAADATYSFVQSTSLAGSTSEALSMLRFNEPHGERIEDNWAGLVGSHLVSIQRVLADEANRKRLLLAAKWYFDSFTGDSELLRFVQAMVSLEILLGEENKEAYNNIGVGELMRNRVAYLIGQDMNERAEILGTFNKLYDVRSRIVHRGHSHLSQEERRHLATLRGYCARVIQAEVKMLVSGDALTDPNWPEAILPTPKGVALSPLLEALAGFDPNALDTEIPLISEAETGRG